MADRFRILVVDDEPLIVGVLRDLFENRGLLVSTAANGYEAIQLLSAGPFDAVVTDLNMPQCDGADLIAEIRRRDGSRLPIIVLTGDSEAGHRLAGLDNLQILRKPAGIAEITAAMNRALPRHKTGA